jgi:acetolactate synthase I/II/III large subunit
MNIYEAIVKGLEDAGVGAAFGGAGESDAGLMLALKHSTRIKPVITRHEQAASFMACGYAMFTDRLGVCFSTAGPGAFNLISGLSVALVDSYPVLAITGASKLKYRGMGSLNETSGLVRTPHAQSIFAATTKKSIELKDAAETVDAVEELINLALAGRPGPVHLAVPADLTDPDISVDNYRAIRLDVQPVRPDARSLEEAARVLADAVRNGKKVLVLAGYGAVRSQAHRDLRAFAERFQIPVITTMDGKGILPEEHPLAVGVLGVSGHASARKAFQEADVVLAIGNSFAQHATFDFQDDLFEGKTLIKINIDPGEMKKVYPPDHEIVADARLAVVGLMEEMSRTVSAVLARDYEMQDYETEKVLGLGRLINPGEMTQSLSRLLPDNAIVLGDAGTHSAWLAYYLELRDGQFFRKPGTFAPMAGNTNGALGVKCAYPDRTVVVGCGDGCYLMSGFEILTAVDYDIPVIWIIFHDDEFKLIKLEQLATFHETALVEFRNPDYAAYARSCGADGYRVETLEEFERAFQSAVASKRPTLIDAMITRKALPHYSPSLEGLPISIARGVWDRIREWFHMPSE